MYAHNMVRVTTCVPHVKLADPLGNAGEILTLYEKACSDGAALVLFPELCVTGYAIDDLLQQDVILEETLAALSLLARKSRNAVLVVGAPVRQRHRLFNCAVVMARGSILGIVPKSYLPNFREFYEARQFVAADASVDEFVELDFDDEEDFESKSSIPFGNNLVFRCRSNADFCFGVEICQDLWVPIPPSTFQAWKGATVLLNLSASNITIGKSEYRKDLVKSTSAKLYAAYVYASAGQGESTNDLSWDGQAIAYESGDFLGASERFATTPTLLSVDIDLGRLIQDRARDMTWILNGRDFRERVEKTRVISFDFDPPGSAKTPTLLAYRRVAKRPYVPSDPLTLSQRCYECYNVQVSGLAQRMRASKLEKVVIGVSGGLDSTHALLVCCRAVDSLGLPRSNVFAYTMPGFATTTLTKSYAWDLMRALGVEANELDIKPSCLQMLKDLDHPYAKGERVYDVTFENVQAGDRTNHLFRIANRRSAFVVGTGDLSELALGWCTYGVGDHMSHYSVNASLSKSLIQCVIQWVIDATFFGPDANETLRNILAVEISPELVPQHESDDDDIETDTKKKKQQRLQSTEAALGPYDLHDFQLYHATRRGIPAAKAAFLACYAWANDNPKHPSALPVEPQPSLAKGTSVLKDRDFPVADILRFQRDFFRKFFLTSQFKRTCVPNAPKVGDGSSLSPRGDWRAPSDNSWAAWERAWCTTVDWACDSNEDDLTLRDLRNQYISPPAPPPH